MSGNSGSSTALKVGLTAGLLASVVAVITWRAGKQRAFWKEYFTQNVFSGAEPDGRKCEDVTTISAEEFNYMLGIMVKRQKELKITARKTAIQLKTGKVTGKEDEQTSELAYMPVEGFFSEFGITVEQFVYLLGKYRFITEIREKITQLCLPRLPGVPLEKPTLDGEEIFACMEIMIEFWKKNQFSFTFNSEEWHKEDDVTTWKLPHEKSVKARARCGDYLEKKTGVTLEEWEESVTKNPELRFDFTYQHLCRELRKYMF